MADRARAVALMTEELTDDLRGVAPTWRSTEEPIYLELIQQMGVPGLDTPAYPASQVFEGVVVSSRDEIDDEDQL